VLVDWNHQKIPFFSEPPALHAAHMPSTIPGSSGQVAPGAETTGHAQIVSAFGAPFVLEGLFGEADAEAMDADSAANNADMDVKDDDATAVVADGGMIVDDDNSHKGGPPCVLQPPFFPNVRQ
jgi:nuclear GTP-binding protein